MTSNDTGSGRQDPTMQFSDPTADPTADPSPDPTVDPVPEAAAPTADPGETTTIPATTTSALPVATPFRVEPATPVPDDAVARGAALPHLPPPTTSAPDPAWPAPSAPSAQPVQSAPQPALVTVRKGPRPGSIMLGLLSILVAAYVLVANITGTDLSFRLVGPSMIGAFGGMLLLVGLAGVVAGRLRR